MALVFLSVLLPSQNDIPELRRNISQQYVDQFLSQVHTLKDLPDDIISPEAIGRLTQVFKMFDKNHDGQLDDDERAAMLAFVRNVQQQQQPKREQ
jgi:Ca2+-binding EF-hand superfamily protein